MPYDRRPVSKSGPKTGRPAKSARSARPGSSNSGRNSSTRGSGAGRGKAAPRRYDSDGTRSAAPRRESAKRDPRATPTEEGERRRRSDSPRSGGRSTGRDRDRVPPRRVEKPKTAAQIRAAAVRAQR